MRSQYVFSHFILIPSCSRHFHIDVGNNNTLGTIIHSNDWAHKWHS